jgi:hypothetical protein
MFQILELSFLFEISGVGINLGFGAWNLVLAF